MEVAEITIEALNIELTAKAEALKKQLGKEIYPFVVIDNRQRFVGFIQEPTLQAKMVAFDKMTMEQSLTLAGEAILESSLVIDESDKAFTSPESRFDNVKLAAYLECTNFVKVLANQYKKK